MKTKTTVQGAILGTLAGAAVGALVGLATGRFQEHRQRCFSLERGRPATGLVAGVYVAIRRRNTPTMRPTSMPASVRRSSINSVAAKANEDLGTQIRLTEQNIDQLRTKVSDVALRRQQASKNVAALKQATENK